MRQEPAQGRQGLLGPVLLPEGEDPADHDHHHDRDADLGHALAGLTPFGKEGQPGGHPQDHGEEVAELLQERDQPRFAPRLLDAVQSVHVQSPLGFGARQPRRRGTEASQGVVGREPADHRPAGAVDHLADLVLLAESHSAPEIYAPDLANPMRMNVPRIISIVIRSGLPSAPNVIVAG